jgi:hypothetical protein
MGTFTLTMKKLEALEKANDIKAKAKLDMIDKLNAEAKALDDESNAANRARNKIKDLIG